MKEKNLYSYEGPVTQFNRVICSKWVGETIAVSAAKAKSQLIYRYKKEHGMVPSAKIEFPGKLILVS